MKKLFTIALVITGLFAAYTASAQKMEDKSKRPSPPDTVKAVTRSGVAIEIDYSQPGVKGRVVGGPEIATFGKVWRTGANEETVFSVSKDVIIEGQTLPAGKYGLFSIPGETEWVIIFNKTSNLWGTKYTDADNFMRVTVKTQKAPAFVERLKFSIEPSGKVSFTWGDYLVSFKAK